MVHVEIVMVKKLVALAERPCNFLLNSTWGEVKRFKLQGRNNYMNMRKKRRANAMSSYLPNTSEMGPFCYGWLSPPHSYKHQLVSPTSLFMVSTLIILQASSSFTSFW